MSITRISLEVLPPTSSGYAETLALLQKYEVQAVSIPDKSAQVNNLDFAAYLQTHSSLEVTVHYSLQHRYSRDLEQIVRDFSTYAKRCLSLGIKRILVVSGSRVRRHTVVELLELYAAPEGPQLFAAFNPYLPDIESELTRARRKLPYVRGLYLQVGEDIDTLRKSLDLLRPSLRNHTLHGCLLYPTKQFQTRFRFRPWKGVYLTSNYLRDLEYARRVYRKYAQVYRNLDIAPLLEVFPPSEKSLGGALEDLDKTKNNR